MLKIWFQINVIKRRLQINKQREDCRDLPGGSVVKTSPSKAGGVGSIPGWGTKIPHAS